MYIIYEKHENKQLYPFHYSLPARTSIIAAANPVGGHYSKSKTVSENLKYVLLWFNVFFILNFFCCFTLSFKLMFDINRMGSALLSRFDLVFILLDKPDEVRDFKKLCVIIMIHEGSKSFFKNAFTVINFISFKIHKVWKLKEMVVHAKYTKED